MINATAYMIPPIIEKMDTASLDIANGSSAQLHATTQHTKDNCKCICGSTFNATEQHSFSLALLTKFEHECLSITREIAKELVKQPSNQATNKWMKVTSNSEMMTSN